MEYEYYLVIIATVSTILGAQLVFGKKHPKYVIYGTQDCEYTGKLLEHLKNEGKIDDFEFKDLNEEVNLEEFTQMDGDATPCVMNPKNNKGIEGFVSYKEITDGLN